MDNNYNYAPNILNNNNQIDKQFLNIILNNEEKNNNENEKNVLNKYFKDDKDEIVKKFRDNFNLSEKNFTKEKILIALEKNDNDFNKAFTSFFN